MIVNRQAGTIQKRLSFNSSSGQLAQMQPPCKNSVEWKNRKLALNSSAQQILSRNSVNENVFQQNDQSDIENTNIMNLTNRSNEDLMNDNGITLNGSSKLFIQRNVQMNIAQEGKDGEISFSKNEDQSEQPSMIKDLGQVHQMNIQANQNRTWERSYIGDDQKIDLYQNVQNSQNWEQKSNERPHHQQTYSNQYNQYEQMLSDLKTDEDIQVSNNTSAAVINNIYTSQQYQMNYNSNNDQSQSEIFNNQRRSINTLFDNIHITNPNLQSQTRRSTQSLHSSNSQLQLNQQQQQQPILHQQKNVFRKPENQIETEDNLTSNEDFFKKKTSNNAGMPPINSNSFRQNNQQPQLQQNYQQLNQIQHQPQAVLKKEQQNDQSSKDLQDQLQQSYLNQQSQQQLQFQQQQQNTQATSIVNYYNATTNEEQFDSNIDETAPIPSTFRKILNENGIKYSAAEYDRLIKQIPNESEMNKLKYYFLPLKIQEQEKIIEKSNQNIIELQDSIQILLKREQSCRQEYHDYQSSVQRDINQLQERQKQLTKDLMEKENMIQSIQIQFESKNNEVQSLQLKLQKQRQEFSNFESTKAEIEFSIKEKEMKIEMIMKENEEIKKENKIIREEKMELLDQVLELERNIQVKDNKTAKLILDRKNQNDDYSIRQNVLIQENSQLREEMNVIANQNKKLIKNLQDYKAELANLKQTVFELASNIPSFKSIQIPSNQSNQIQEQIPTSLVNQYVELLKQQLQHLKSVEEIQNKKVNTNNNNVNYHSHNKQVEGAVGGVFNGKQEQNKQFEGNVSTFRRQELD